ncbi:hypothetical protein [Flavisphingomonas formosensis]|uniref:hypothetical protein n=1 Tax=Flavisphingomonas formosensis TaxID=861534 RepID=UPI0012FC3B60|nr:hypothetical protein [Sphingomonas formosensis]
MAKLSFNLNGYLYQKGVSEIEIAYKETVSALSSRKHKLEIDLTENARAVEAREIDPYERDADGSILYEKEKAIKYSIDDAASSLRIARESYVIILHHYWEKRCDEWMHSKKNYDPLRAYNFLEKNGLAVDRSRLEILRLSCNTLKHNSSNLFEGYPGMFDQNHMNDATRVSYANALRLTDSFVEEMFEAIRSSGIQIDSNFAPGF